MSRFAFEASAVGDRRGREQRKGATLTDAGRQGMTTREGCSPVGTPREDSLMQRDAHGLGTGLPACICLHAGPLGQQTIAVTPTAETLRLTCMGCGRTRDIEVAHGARLPRFLY